MSILKFSTHRGIAVPLFLFLSIGIEPAFISQLALADPIHCDKDGYPSCYNVGYQDGQNDYKSGYYITCTHHSWQYCQGYNSGYYNTQSDNNNRQDSGQSSDIRISGNNKVEVTQDNNQANHSPQDNTDGNNGGGNGY